MSNTVKNWQAKMLKFRHKLKFINMTYCTFLKQLKIGDTSGRGC